MRTTPPKSRDTLIAETTQRLLGDWAAEIKAGVPRAISDLHNTVLDRLSGDECKALFIQAATDQAGANAGFAALVGQAMTDVCAADAERIADILLGQLVDNANESRIDRAIEAQAA